jgi:S1-C subfamily serine protease
MSFRASPWVVLVVLAASCSGPQDRAAGGARQATGASAGVSDEPSIESMANAVTRERLAEILGRGVGDFLRHVAVEPVLDGGAFVGFRLESLPDQPAWFDVRRGDVVTAINGMSIERPEDAQRAWEALQVASEVRIDLLREGERRSVRVPIEDAPEGGEGAPAPAAADEDRGADDAADSVAGD